MNESEHEILTRVPCFPELKVLAPCAPGLPLYEVLSLLLYWESLPDHQSFNRRIHAAQLSHHLREPLPHIEASLDRLEEMGLVSCIRQELSFPGSVRAEKQHRTDCLVQLDFPALADALTARGVRMTARVLSHASDDSFDFYTQINELVIPVIQRLEGDVSGAELDACAESCARFICALAADDPEFIARALAPGWRLMVAPPANWEDIKRRWLEDGHAIDLGLTDGNFFLRDGNVYGHGSGIIEHRRRDRAPRILAHALLIRCAQAVPELGISSELEPGEQTAGRELASRYP